ncbi:MAG: TorF family putative porin [Bacteroidota bacterium]|nr:TorF family putative porin [Bacteroidota bacterium]
MKLIKNSIILIFVVMLSFASTDLKAQDFGADVVSSYVWRGTQFGTGPAVQPWFTLPELTSGLELGVWGSFPTSDAGTSQTYELDLYASYDFGPFALTVTNYTFPTATGAYDTANYELFDGDMEVSASTSLGAIGLTVGYFTDLEALYVEAGTTLAGMNLAIGYGSDGDSAFYAGGESGLVNVSLGGSKDIKITDDYSLPLFGSFIYNPDAEAAFMVVGMSF